MNLGDLFKDFKLDSWYKVFVVIGAFGFVIALTVDVKAITNAQLALLSGGMFFLGLGVWKGEYEETGFMPPNIYTGGTAWKVTQTKWAAEPLGCTFDIVGLILIGLFVFNLLSSGSSTTLVPTPTYTVTPSPTPTETYTPTVISPTPTT